MPLGAKHAVSARLRLFGDLFGCMAVSVLVESHHCAMMLKVAFDPSATVSVTPTGCGAVAGVRCGTKLI